MYYIRRRPNIVVAAENGLKFYVTMPIAIATDQWPFVLLAYLYWTILVRHRGVGSRSVAHNGKGKSLTAIIIRFTGPCIDRNQRGPDIYFSALMSYPRIMAR